MANRASQAISRRRELDGGKAEPKAAPGAPLTSGDRGKLVRPFTALDRRKRKA